MKSYEIHHHPPSSRYKSLQQTDLIALAIYQSCDKICNLTKLTWKFMTGFAYKLCLLESKRLLKLTGCIITITLG